MSFNQLTFDLSPGFFPTGEIQARPGEAARGVDKGSAGDYQDRRSTGGNNNYFERHNSEYLKWSCMRFLSIVNAAMCCMLFMWQ